MPSLGRDPYAFVDCLARRTASLPVDLDDSDGPHCLSHEWDLEDLLLGEESTRQRESVHQERDVEEGEMV